jgi:hypothetical protein
MTTIDRRRLIGAILCGVSAGLVLTPGTLGAMPIDARVPQDLDGFIERAQVVVVNPRRRRHRRWVCWWRRGRRVCGWRWV